MDLQVESGSLTLGAIFKLVAVGWFLGTGLVIGLPIIILSILLALFGHNAGMQSPWLVVLLIPFILAAQSLIVVCLVSIGLWLYRRWTSISVVSP